MNKKFFLFLMLCLSSLSIKAGMLSGDFNNLVPYKVYAYILAMPVGSTGSSAFSFTWKVKNGKIMDLNGNFTLTSSTVDVNMMYTRTIYIIWDSVSTGQLDLYANSYSGSSSLYISQEISIESPNLEIYNKSISGSNEAFYWTNLIIHDCEVNTGANVTFQGYKSVRITPPFRAYNGSNVRICAEMDTTALIGWADNDPIYQLAELYSCLPNPVTSSSLIHGSVPPDIDISSAQLLISDLNGNRITTIHLTRTNEWEFYVEINVSIFPRSGLYIYSLLINGFSVDSKRLQVVI